MIGSLSKFNTISSNNNHEIISRKQIDKSRNRIQKLNKKLEELNGQKLEILKQAKFSKKYNKCNIKNCFKRVLNKIIQLTSKSHILSKIELDEKTTLNLINVCSQELNQLENSYNIAMRIQNAFRTKNIEKQLNLIMHSTTTEIFANAVQQLFKNAIKYEDKVKLRRFLCSIFFTITDYIRYNKDSRLLLPQSCCIVINYLQKQKDPENPPPIELPCAVFTEPCQLVDYVLNTKRNENDQPEILLTPCYSSGSTDVTLHITPFLLKQVDRKNILLIWTDSVANTDYFLNEINSMISLLQSKGMKLNIFYLPNSRQSSKDDCAIFAIQDAISFSKHHKELISQCLNILKEEPNFNFHQGVNFPHRFFWMAQKSELAKTLIETIPKEEVKEFIQKYIEYIKTTTSGGKLNFRAKRIGDKYEGIIWNYIINRGNRPSKGILPILRPHRFP